jgi:hypothetical protein
VVIVLYEVIVSRVVLKVVEVVLEVPVDLVSIVDKVVS